MKKLVILSFIIITKAVFGQDCLNVQFKLRGYFYAGSSQVDSTAAGGFYEDSNNPKNLSSEIFKLSESGKLQIAVKPEATTAFEKGISGFKVFVINTSDSIQKLPAQDSRLYLKRQVFYKNQWRDIEYLPSSWCGNSYHSVFIKPNEYWDFTAPCLVGKIESKFRFELYVNDKMTVYSNVFDGSFNEKQLVKAQGYSPTGIMDPYEN